MEGWAGSEEDSVLEGGMQCLGPQGREWTAAARGSGWPGFASGESPESARGIDTVHGAASAECS